MNKLYYNIYYKFIYMFIYFSAIPSDSHVIKQTHTSQKKSLFPAVCFICLSLNFEKARFNVKQAMLATLACVRVSADV